MKCGVIVFPGSNCDLDAYHVLKDVLGLPVRYIWHEEKELMDMDLVVLPGGFSYGDYLRPGAIARFSPVMNGVTRFANGGGLVLGICNGFQILTEAGLLPGALYRNNHLQFRCAGTRIRVENNRTPFTRQAAPGQVLRIPVANGDGCYYTDPESLAEMEEWGQVVFRYVDERGYTLPEADPSGSVGHIAGICSKEGNVLGMMPHPERSSEAVLGSEDGLTIFQSAISFLEGRKG